MTPALTTPPEPPLGGKEWWDWYFSPGGGWERNGGRNQTRTFAETFCRLVDLGGERDFTLLDIGCGLGEAIRVFSRRYPRARLSGIDISEVAVARCVADLGDLGKFSVGRIDDVSGYQDVIYISNVLEHFTDYQEKARRLARHCGRLCIMVPYEERRNEAELSPDPQQHHQYTFKRHSFDYLVKERLASSVQCHVVSCPGAWGWSRSEKIAQVAKNVLRPLLGKPRQSELFQAVFDVRTTTACE